MNLLDKAIAYVSPERAARRELARTAFREAQKINRDASLSGLHDAHPGSHDAPINNRGTSMDRDLELGYDRRNIVDRARAAEENNVLADSLLTRTTEAVIGDGFVVKPRTADKKWNREAKALFDGWALDPRECDSRALNDLNGQLELTLRSKLRDGDVLPIQLADGTLRIAESDELSAFGYFKPSMADGVECDRRGRPIAYHVYDYDPDVIWSDRRFVSDAQRTRIPAEFCHFMARRQRLGQTRGLSAFTGGFTLLEQFDGTIRAATVSFRMAACLGLVITRENPFVNLQPNTGANGQPNSEASLGPGKILRLKPGEGVTQVTPGPVGAAYESHYRLLVRLIALRFGLPLELALFDFSTSNYANARTVLLQAKKVWKKHQHHMKALARWIYHWKIISWIEEGKLRARPDALEHKWEVPGWNWIDPVAEVTAAMARVDAGFATKSMIAAEHGVDYEDLLEERRLELELAEAAGVPEVRSNLTRDVQAEATHDGEGKPLAPAPQRSQKNGAAIRMPVLPR